VAKSKEASGGGRDNMDARGLKCPWKQGFPPNTGHRWLGCRGFNPLKKGEGRVVLTYLVGIVFLPETLN
jgi:hypothetical protein